MLKINGGIELTDKEFRCLAYVKRIFERWECHDTCSECCFNEDGYCLIKNFEDGISNIFDEVIIL